MKNQDDIFNSHAREQTIDNQSVKFLKSFHFVAKWEKNDQIGNALHLGYKIKGHLADLIDRETVFTHDRFTGGGGAEFLDADRSAAITGITLPTLRYAGLYRKACADSFWQNTRFVFRRLAFE